MNCDRVRRLLSSYIDGRLSLRNWNRVEEHLQGCESCRRELFDLKQSVGALQALALDDPGPEFNAAVARRLKEAQEARQARRESVTTLGFKWAIGLAALFVVVIAAIPLYVSNLDHFVARQDIYVIGQDSLIPGSTASVRVVVANRGAQNPIEGAYVRLALADGRGLRAIRLMSGRTNKAGTLDGRFRVPAKLSGDYRLVASVSSPLGGETINVPVELRRAAKVLLTTDKPIYQPGQVIHLRALALLRPSLKPASGDETKFIVEDPRGNKVFQKTVAASEWGIASAEFQLGEELNLGRYTIKATFGETETQKTVTVKRYVLPKFKVTLDTDRTYYLPGQTIKGDVAAWYFFGKPVANGRVRVNISALSVKYETLAEISGRTNGDGGFTFEARIPNFLAGQPLEKGSAMVKIVTSVTDTAGHTEEIVRTVPVAKAPIRIAMVPESGDLVPDLDNIVYVVTSYPDGCPAWTEVSLKTEGGSQRAESDALGVSVFHVTPPAGDFSLEISARTANGLQATERFKLHAGNELSESVPSYAWEYTRISDPASLGGILIRTDKAVYNAGETAEIAVLSTKKSGSVYLDAVLDGQTALTQTLHLNRGRASFALDLSNDYAGTLTFSAYILSPLGVPVRDTATVLVRSANELNVGIKPDRQTYRPGEKARVAFEVRNRDGIGIPAAIGVNIVDESVFSVEEQMPGLAALYFALQEEILKPRYQTKFAVDEDFYREAYRDPEGYARRIQQQLLEARPQIKGDLPSWSDPNALLGEDRNGTIQRAAKVMFASATSAGETQISAVTQEEKDGEISRIRSRFWGWGQERWAVGFLLAVLVSLQIAMAVSAYRRRLRLAMATSTLAVAGMAAFVVSGLIGCYLPYCYGPDPNNIVHGVGLLSSIALTVAAMVLLARGAEMWWQVGCGFLLFLGLAAVFFPVFSSARECAKGSAMMSRLRQFGLSFQMHDEATPQMPRPGAKPIRVRQFFPETLYSNPAVITDESGRGAIDLTAADSITTWRISALASSMNGEVGSANAPMRVFQDFFVDLDLPVGVTQGDVISVPVAVYNYLPRAQSVTLTLRAETWFRAQGPNVKIVKLGANEVGVAYFPIEVVRLGRHSLTVEARSDLLSDAVQRELTVYPNGQEQSDVANGILSDETRAAVWIPPYAIPNATKLLVKIYPGAFSQVIEGLDALLRVPYGCFEQTSSITYPNVLVLKYLKAVKKDKPEISMKAEQFINLGYQRLLTFEVRGGGFDWFGRAPANTVLTAYGIMELSDMADVFTVDRSLIERAKRLLETRQNSDGSWSLDVGTYTWGTLEAELPVTAYVAWALAEGGYGDSPTAVRARGYLRPHIEDVRDPYVLALIANALVASGSDEAAASQALDKLAKCAQVHKGRASWNAGVSTLTYGSGSVAGTETTALAAYAFLKSGSHVELAKQALAELVATRDKEGGWATTQATILALKALLAGASTSVGGRADIELRVNGEVVETVRLSSDDAETMHVVDATRLARAGSNVVEMNVRGRGRPAYQVIAKYYVPWSRVPKPAPGPLQIDVGYSKLRIGKEGVVDMAATVRATAEPIKMAIVDLGLPPGFGVITDDLEALKAKCVIERYEITSRQIILYLHNLAPGHPVKIVCRLRALYPVRAVAPASGAYDYYNPESVRSLSKPVRIEVL